MPVSSVRVTEGSGPYLHTWQRSVSSVNREEQYVQRGEPALPTYTASFENISIATANDHFLQLMSGSSTYTRVNRIVIWQEVAAGTAAVTRLQVIRLTTAGTGGTSVTPRPFDTADTANATAMTLPSSKGTEGVLLIPIVKIIRQAILTTAAQDDFPFVWEASDRGKPIIIPSGTANGIALKTFSARASATVTGFVEFTETAWL
jgi:hypothetical protein